VRIAVTGSVATDHLMTFPGKFTEQLIADKLDRVSLSFLVDGLEIRKGGVAANIAFGMGCLGLQPLLVGAVGQDFADYRSWLDAHGVDTSGVLESKKNHTARFVCTTDTDGNQIASFYPGAMAEARDIAIEDVAAQAGGVDLVLIGADDPDAMFRHTAGCLAAGIPFAADPSQQLARMDGDQTRKLVDGAAYLFSNEYELAMIEQKTGWTAADIAGRVQVQVTTLGADGARITQTGQAPITVPSVPGVQAVDPTGAGDAFRAGFLAGVAWELPLERSAQLGSLVAVQVLESFGPQEYQLTPEVITSRMETAYGADAAKEVAQHLGS
jgi:adenosine kinase